jgi:hypothetical protein
MLREALGQLDWANDRARVTEAIKQQGATAKRVTNSLCAIMVPARTLSAREKRQILHIS